MEPQTTEPKSVEMTTNTKIVIGVIVVAFVFGGVSYFMKGKNPSMNSADDRNLENSAPLESTNPNAQIDNSSTGTTSTSGSLSSLWSMSGDHKCDVTITEQSVKGSGTVYVSQGKIRADFSMEIPQLGNKSMVASMIQMDGQVYSWTNMYPQGFKTKVVANSDPLASMNTGGIKTNPSVKYSCVSWTPDSSKFELPSGVTFTATGR